MQLESLKSLMLDKHIAYLPGSHDRGGSRLLLYPSQGQWVNHPYEDILSLTAYLTQLVDWNDTPMRRRYFTVIIDMRSGWIQYLKRVLKAVQQAVFPHVRQVLILKPDQFLERQRVFVDIVLEAYEFKVILISLHKLSRHFELTQLPPALGGTYPFDPVVWVAMRERYEKYLQKSTKFVQQLRAQKGENGGSLDVDEIQRAINHGESLSQELLSTPSDAHVITVSSFVNPEQSSASKRILGVVQQMKDILNPPENEEMQRQSAERLQQQFLLGVENMLEWFLHAGERWLLTLHEIGESREEAEQLVREHETLLNKSSEVARKVDELNQLAEQLNSSGVDGLVDTKRDTLTSVCEQFVGRVQRQLQMCRQSSQFHSDFVAHNSKMDSLLEILCSEPDTADLRRTEAAVNELDERLGHIDQSQEHLLSSGRSFLDELTVTEYNCQGNPITRDYVAGVVHIRKLLAHIVNRRKRCNDLADVRKLKLQQMLQLCTCEQDCRQATNWLYELNDTFERDLSSPVDGTDEAIMDRHMQHNKLHSTAKSTYDYGRQLLQTALLLRRSLRMDEQEHMELSRQMDQGWSKFCRTLSDNEARLNLSRVFRSTAQQVDHQLNNLTAEVRADGTTSEILAKMPSVKLSSPGSATNTSERGSNWSETDLQGKYGPQQRKLDGDVLELKHMAQMLTQGGQSNHIRSLLDEIEHKQRHLDALINDATS